MPNIRVIVPKQNTNIIYSVPEPIPDPTEHPFRWCLSGHSNSGKTNVIANCLLDYWMEADKTTSLFSEIFIFTPSAITDPTFQYLIENEDIKNKMYISDELNFDMLSELIQTPCDGRRLIWLDDWASDKHSLENPIIKSVFMRGRHTNTSVCITTQHWYQLPISIRGQASYVSIWPVTENRTELMVADELTTIDDNRNKILQMLKEAWIKPFSFMHVNLDSKPRKFYSSFEYELYFKNPDGLAPILEEKEIDNDNSDASVTL